MIIMDPTLEFSSRIKHACRNGYFHEVQRLADEALHKFPNEVVFKFYKGVGLLLLRKNNDALRILEPLQRERPISLAVCLASITAHKACVQVDRESVASLESKVKDSKKTSSAEELCFAGIFFSLIGNPEKAKDYLESAFKQSSPGSAAHAEILCAKGWLQLQLMRKGSEKPAASEYFEPVLKENRKHCDALLGLAHYYELIHRSEAAIEKLSQILATLPNWIPALVEKMKVLESVDWDQVQDTANRIEAIEDNLEARRMKILYVLCHEGKPDVAVSMLGDFFTAIKKYEPQNATYFVENARLFSQLGSFSHPVVAEGLKFARYAAELEIDNAEFITDIGHLHLMMDNWKGAQEEFRTAMEMDKTSVPALLGLISCLLADEKFDQANHQLEFLRESGSSMDKPPEVLYLSSVVARERNESAEVVLKFLSGALDSHFAKLKGLPNNVQYLKLINPDLVLKIVRGFLQFAPDQPTGPGMPIPPVIKQATMILEVVLKASKCHRDALFIYARVKYLSGDFRSAISTLDQLTNIDPSLMGVALLLAQIHISQNDFDLASSALDNGLSSNFKIREHPKYHLLLAKVQRNNGDLKSAIKALNAASTMSKSKSFMKSTVGDLDGFSEIEKMDLYMELISLHRQQGNFEDANNFMQEALAEFKGTLLEGRLGLIQAEEMIENGDLDKALALLRAVQPDQNHFIESRKLMSEIYLNYRPDNEQYIQCFTEIVNNSPIPVNLVMLADAYMSIQDPDKAVEMYEMALAKNPRDPVLASKMGQALVLTHQYNKAVNYYKDAVKNDESFSLRFDLATLHMKLKQWERAEKTITQALSEMKDNSSNSMGLNSLMMEVKFLILLAKVSQGAGNSGVAHQNLVRAKDSQNRVLKRIGFEQPTNLEEQKAVFCTICKLLGDVADKPAEIEFAIRSLKEALEICPEEWQCLIVLAKLYMRNGNHVQCQQTCQQLLKVKKDCVEASLMLGELFFRKADFQSSSFHFQQFLDRNPTNWKSLMWFIECGRRTGNLSEAESYLKSASSVADPNDPGYGYCQGIYEWYSGNSNSALKMLNKARKDPLYGYKALIAMIDIYINPTSSVMGGDALETSGASGDGLIANGGGGKADFRDVTLNTAESLIHELNAKNQNEKFRRHILECFVLIASKNKAKVEKGTQELSGLITTDAGKESVMLVYALATGYMFAKQVPKARNQLKRVTKSNWYGNVEDAEYLERCWLLLADIYIQTSKFDLATELIKKVLQYNKSCYKANEYYGFIMEKEQAYADAAANYEAAWKLTNCTNPAMGYKLAFNYLKAKRYTDAIDVCHIVLAKFPTYPKIKKEILDKARANLRP